MSEIIEVTDKVNFEYNDDECLPITKCVCGEKFVIWDQILGVYKDNPWECPKCGAKLFFTINIQVYEVSG